MRAHLKYLSYVIRHKWFVLRAGLKTGAPLWRLGAGRAITGRWEVVEWYTKHKQSMVLHSDTRLLVESLLSDFS